MERQISANKRRTWVMMLFFVAIIWALAFLISKVMGQPGILFTAGIFSLVYALISYFSGAKMALAMNRAKEINEQDNPRLWRTVREVAMQDNLPMPRVYIMNDPAPNAFATGRNHKHSYVCATTGLLEMMNDSELKGVIAHEMGHVKNYDIRVNTIAFALAGIISMIGDFFFYSSIFGGRDEENNNGLLQILAIVAVVLAPIAATLIQLAISRRREYLADATGAETLHNPQGLASALEKIGRYGSALQTKQNTATAHMFFANPLSAGTLAGLFSTHPPIEKRIEILRSMTL